MTDTIKNLIASLALLTMGAFGTSWWLSKQNAAPSAEYAVAKDAAPKTLKVDVPVKTGTVRVKKGAEASLKIPIYPNEGVIAASSIAPSERRSTVATVIDTDTGHVRTIVREEPLPWLAADVRGGLGMYYGIAAGQPAVMIQARQALFTVKSVHVQAVGQVVQPLGLGNSQYFVGVGAEYRW